MRTLDKLDSYDKCEPGLVQTVQQPRSQEPYQEPGWHCENKLLTDIRILIPDEEPSLETSKSCLSPTISDIEIWDTYIGILFLNTIVQNSNKKPPPPFQCCYMC